jgi:hypothetical protein
MVQFFYNGGREGWLIRCKNNMKKLNKTLTLCCILRTNLPEILTGWDRRGE